MGGPNPPGRVGVTGHRPDRLVRADDTRLVEVVDGVLRVLSARGHRVLVSGLAEGADRVVAHRALASQWRLEALLPFVPERYEDDFATASSRAEFRALLGRSDGVEVFGDPATAADDPPEMAYHAQGRRLVERCSVLVTIWNGARARGPGGTGEVVRLARASQTPVVWIHSDAPHEVRLWRGPEVEGPWSGPLGPPLSQALARSDGSADR